MNSLRSKVTFTITMCALGGALGMFANVSSGAQSSAAPKSANSAPAATSISQPQTFATAEKAADALVDAAERFDVPALIRIVGEQGEEVILTEGDAAGRG